MRITLVRPPFYSLVGITTASHPLSLGYLSSALVEAGEEVSVVDGEILKYDGSFSFSAFLKNLMVNLLPHLGLKKRSIILEEVMNDYHHNMWNTVVNKIIDTRPDVIGITCFTVSMTSVKIIVNRLLEALPEARIVLGGIHIASMPEQALRDIQGITCVVIGEGERTIVELCNELKKDTPSLESVKGVAFLSSTGQFVRTPHRELIADLDNLPLPTREWQGHQYASQLGLSSRGCPFTCSFCDSRSIWTRKVRYVSLNRVMAELDYLNSMDATFFRYSDDTFTIKKDRIAEWCKRVRENGYNKRMKFGFGTRIELITKECMEDYASAGVVDISFGIETGSQRVRRLISKDFGNVDPYEAIKALNGVGISTRTYFMVGHPTERPEDVQDTITLIKKMSSLPRNYIEINVCCPYPGTELWALAMEKTNGKPFVDIDTYYKMFHHGSPIMNLTDIPDDELDDFVRRLHRISALSVLKSRVSLWGGQLLTNPIPTIKIVKNRLFP